MQDHPLLHSYKQLTNDRTVTVEAFYLRQKELLKQALADLKQNHHADLDYLVGWIALYEGDKYSIPFKNAFGHLNRSYKNGNEAAGIMLSDALKGAIAGVPEEMINQDKALEILETLGSSGSVRGAYGLALFYLDKINFTIEGGGYAPEDWFDLCYKNASIAADAGFLGGLNLLGQFHAYGFGSKIIANPKEGMMFLQKAVDLKGTQEDEGFLSDALFTLGGFYYDGFGVARDRKKGLALINDSADLGNIYAQDWLIQNQESLAIEGMTSDHDDIVYEEDFEDMDLSPAPKAADSVIVKSGGQKTRH